MTTLSLRKQLFGNVGNTLTTVLFLAVSITVLVYVARWAFIDSLWTEAQEGQCAHITGACWAVIHARYRLILFGLYPYDEHWRSALARPAKPGRHKPFDGPEPGQTAQNND